MIRLCAGENILCLSYRVCSFIYLPFVHHKNLCRDCGSLFSSIYHNPVPWSVSQYVPQSIYTLSVSVCTDPFISLPTTQHLTPTTPKHFLFYYFIELKVVRQNCPWGPHRLRIIFSHSSSGLSCIQALHFLMNFRINIISWIIVIMSNTEKSWFVIFLRISRSRTAMDLWLLTTNGQSR